MAAQKKVDYEAIEPGWRAGLKSPAQLAAEYTKATGTSVSRSAIIKHFEKLGVPRDLSAKVRAKADAMVAEAMVTGKVSTETTMADAAIVNAAAVDVATVRLSHRKDIAKGRTLAMSLMEELEAQTGSAELMQKLGEIMGDPDKSGNDKKLAEAYQKAISLGGRVQTMRSLADTIRTLVSLEREAYGLDNIPEAPVDDIAMLTDDALDARISERLRVAGL